jgi:hypothetical protein
MSFFSALMIVPEMTSRLQRREDRRSVDRLIQKQGSRDLDRNLPSQEGHRDAMP